MVVSEWSVISNPWSGYFGCLLIFSEGERLAFRGVVAVPLGDFYDVVAGPGDDGLAAESAVELLVGGHVEAVDFVVFGFRDTGLILDPEMAGGAGADASAGVVEEDVVIFGYIEEGHGFAVVLVGHGAEFKLDDTALGLEGDANEF
jgi:hypothetical protein